MNNGFTIKDIFGEETFRRGMTPKQMQYFFKACETVKANRIQELMFAYGRVQADKEGGEKMDASLKSMEGALIKALFSGEI